MSAINNLLDRLVESTVHQELVALQATHSELQHRHTGALKALKLAVRELGNYTDRYTEERFLLKAKYYPPCPPHPAPTT